MSVLRFPFNGRGFGLLESLLVMALFLTMAAAVYTTLAPASQATQVEQEARRLDSLRQGVTSAYASAQSFATLTPQRAIDEGWLGSGSGDGRSTAWGPFALSAANLGGMPGDGWRVTLADLPSGVCERILAWQVRRGSKSQTIEYWQFEKEERDKRTGEKQTVRLDRPKVFHAAVFHASQVDGMPELVVPKHEWDPIARVEALLKESGASVHHRAGATPHYAPMQDHIVLPDREQFLDAGRYAATALHELGHWTGHPTRLNRDLSNRFGTEGYAREELRAEISSYLMGQELAIGHDPGNHHAYVASWIQALKEDPREIFRACADAEKIVALERSFDRYQEHTHVAEEGQEQPSQSRAAPVAVERTTAPATTRPAPRQRKARAPKAMGMLR